MNTLKQWMQQSTTEQKERVAELADTSIPTMRLAANGYRTDGNVNLTAEFAARLEQAIGTVNLNLDLPEVKREHLCKACSTCPYQIKCNQN